MKKWRIPPDYFKKHPSVSKEVFHSGKNLRSTCPGWSFSRSDLIPFPPFPFAFSFRVWNWWQNESGAIRIVFVATVEWHLRETTLLVREREHIESWMRCDVQLNWSRHELQTVNLYFYISSRPEIPDYFLWKMVRFKNLPDFRGPANFNNDSRSNLYTLIGLN